MMTERDGAASILYRHENEPCSIKVRGSRVTVIRHGSGTRMEIEEGAAHMSRYVTPMGALSFEIAAHKVDNRLDTEGILTLEYRISAGGEADENKVIIKTEEI